MLKFDTAHYLYAKVNNARYLYLLIKHFIWRSHAIYGNIFPKDFDIS